MGQADTQAASFSSGQWDGWYSGSPTAMNVSCKWVGEPDQMDGHNIYPSHICNGCCLDGWMDANQKVITHQKVILQPTLRKFKNTAHQKVVTYQTNQQTERSTYGHGLAV